MAMTMAEAGRKGGLVRSQAKKDAARRSAAKRTAPKPVDEPVVFQCPQTQPTKSTLLTVAPKQGEK